MLIIQLYLLKIERKRYLAQNIIMDDITISRWRMQEG